MAYRTFTASQVNAATPTVHIDGPPRLTFMTQCEAVPTMLAKPGIGKVLLPLDDGVSLVSLVSLVSFPSEKVTLDEDERILATETCCAVAVVVRSYVLKAFNDLYVPE